MVFAHSSAWKNSSHAYPYRGGNCNCLLSHIARWLPIANNFQECYTLFRSLILDHGVLLKISIPDPIIVISSFLFDTSFHHGFQLVIIRS